ncbi:response regulator transcription factor [Geosporobacter ferrireducens]|uniref:Stage 0 sporulation protein A homolog n=1 Tax=Geosporobacter ferrireducens TaxID=1424294 RepID=A0A1D8GNI8_9FIRM|nr:response regulator transcription factor [Geosporobacter ferrireducens]AOT72437.1 DNA-binding response regulator [Geosporobacter ferrireducens]MTI56303.1 response regulator transcription factor [Geosporobacter ferrireducens]
MDIQILVVEDDESINDMVKKFLVAEGYSVDTCFDGDEALEQLYKKNYQLVILDIMLPGTNGQELLKELRKIHDIPVLMMTALDDADNQIRAFNNEADDYVTKPFTMQILMKRVEALLRRSGSLKKEISMGKLTLYPLSYKAEYNGRDLGLTPKEFDILFLLTQNKGDIIPHETLITKIWGYDFDGNEGIIHASMKRLRDKLPVNMIKTVKGVGYCLEENEK